MNQKEKLDKEYDIFNIWNSSRDLGLKVNIGKLSPLSPHDEQLFLSQYMAEWVTGMRAVCWIKLWCIKKSVNNQVFCATSFSKKQIYF